MITDIGDNPGLGLTDITDGTLTAPTGPGLGVDVDETELAKHPHVEGDTYAELFPEHESGRTAHAGTRDEADEDLDGCGAVRRGRRVGDRRAAGRSSHAGEVQVRFDYAGLCQSDEHLRFGSAGRLPIVGGHEGAGVVEAVGSGVHDLHLVTTSSPPSCPPAAGAGGA